MRLIQTAITALALIAATPLAADEIASDAPPRNPMGQLVELARQNMMHAVDAANKRVGYCADLGKATLVKPDAIAKLRLTSGEFKIALLYLHLKAENACMSAAINTATVEILMFKAIEIKAYGRNDPEPFTDSKFQFTAEEMCCDNAELYLNRELNYKRLNADKRAALEAIPELKKPFNLLALSDHFIPPPVSAEPERTAR